MFRHNHVFMRFPEGKYKAVTGTFDDGSNQDKWLVARLLERGMKGTFNLNMGLLPDKRSDEFDFDSLDERIFPVKQWQHRMNVDEIRELFTGTGMELATHGWLHAQLPMLTDEALFYEILQDKKALEAIAGEPVHGHAYAQGDLNDRVCELLPKAGIYYARTAFFTHGFDIPRDFMRWGATVHYNDHDSQELADKFLELKDDERGVYYGINPKLFNLFAHSYEFDAWNAYGAMEKMLDKLGGKDDTWYCTNIEYYRYAKAFEALEYDLERTVVYNPSAISVWILVNDNIVEAKPGVITKI